MSRAAIGQVFNIGNVEEVTHPRAGRARQGGDRLARREIVTIPYDQAYEAGFEDMPRRVPDLDQDPHAIGYEPKVELDEIIERVVAEKRDLRRQQPHRCARPRVHGLEHGGPGCPRALFRSFRERGGV